MNKAEKVKLLNDVNLGRSLVTNSENLDFSRLTNEDRTQLDAILLRLEKEHQIVRLRGLKDLPLTDSESNFLKSLYKRLSA